MTVDYRYATIATLILVAVTAPAMAHEFAVFHGHAHGTELPQATGALAYSAGFVVATGLLHLAGIGLGLFVRWPTGRISVRAVGGVIALAGGAFLTGMV